MKKDGNIVWDKKGVNMGANGNFIESVKSVQQMNEFLSGQKVSCTTQDKIFKDIFRYKWVAAMILKNAILEYRDMHPMRIARLIRDDRARGHMSDEDIVGDEIDLVGDVEGSGVQKTIITDLKFRAYTDESRKLENLITVNFEMQNKFYKEKPNTISRAVYYAATALNGTVASGDSEYTNLHKVYTIWLCSESITFKNTFSISEICDTYHVDYLYKHRMNMRRSYDEIPNHSIKQDIEIDLMEVVMFDLTELRRKVSDNKANKAEELMLESLDDMGSAIVHMEQEYKVDLTSYSEEVKKQMSLIESLQVENEEKDKKNEELQEELKKQKRLAEEQKRLAEEQKRLAEEKERENEELRRKLAALQPS